MYLDIIVSYVETIRARRRWISGLENKPISRIQEEDGSIT